MERKARIDTKTVEVLLFQKPNALEMNRKARMNTKPMEVLLFQPISLQPSVCHRKEKMWTLDLRPPEKISLERLLC